MYTFIYGIIILQIKLPSVIKLFVLSIVEWPFKTGFTYSILVTWRERASESDQEIPQSHTTYQLTAPRGRDTHETDNHTTTRTKLK